MRVTEDNIKDIKYFAKDTRFSGNIEKSQVFLKSLLYDLNDLNKTLESNSRSNKKLFIDYIEDHIEYSPERTNPCPDYYGLFRLVFESNPSKTVCVEMNLDELDTALCSLIDFENF